MGYINRVTDVTQDDNTVVGQDPEGGEKVPEGSRVNLTVTQASETFEMPPLEGSTLEEARKIGDQYGFTVEENGEEASDDVEEGKIIRQDPQAGKEVKKGQNVLVVVSTGPESDTMPNLDDVPEEQAKKQLEDAGYTVTVERASSSNTDKGCVMMTSPRKGEPVQKGQNIIITISTGPAQNEVPNVIGKTEGAAKDAIENAGFSVGSIDRVTSDQAAGTVIGQDPGAGASLEGGKKVSLTVSDGPAQTEPEPPANPDPDTGNEGEGGDTGTGEGGDAQAQTV